MCGSVMTSFHISLHQDGFSLEDWKEAKEAEGGFAGVQWQVHSKMESSTHCQHWTGSEHVY